MFLLQKISRNPLRILDKNKNSLGDFITPRLGGHSLTSGDFITPPGHTIFYIRESIKVSLVWAFSFQFRLMNYLSFTSLTQIFSYSIWWWPVPTILFKFQADPRLQPTLHRFPVIYLWFAEVVTSMKLEPKLKAWLQIACVSI